MRATGVSDYMEPLPSGQNRRSSYVHPPSVLLPGCALIRPRTGVVAEVGLSANITSPVGGWHGQAERRHARVGVGTTASMTEIDAELLRIMVCPVARAPLVQFGNWLYSTDPATRRKYAIRDGIPIMLIDESEIADRAEFDRAMTEASKIK